MTIFDKYGSVLIDIDVDDTSVRYKAIKGENSLSLKFSLAEHLEVPLGSYCVFKGEKYLLMLPEDLTMIHRRAFEYSIIMHSEDYRAKRYKFVNPVDGRLKFPLTAKPIDHLQMFVDNMNMRDGAGAWQVGECPDHVEILLSYNHTFCFDALVQLADKLELDYWFDGRVVNIGKLEIDKDSPLPLSYGGDGLGLKSNIKRTNFSDALPLEVLYVEGTTQNIDPSKYGSNELHLPKSYTIGYDGEHFSDETGFDASKARYYKTDANGYSLSRNGKEIVNHSEDSLNCTEIEPTKEEEVKSVVEVNEEKHFYDILFESDVDYSKYVIEGEQAYIVFQSGMLAGKEFDLATDTNGNLICKKEGSRWRVEIVPQEIDGITMPDKKSGYMPVQGNTFKVFGIQLPDEYIEEAEVKMLKHAIKHFYTNEEVQYTISGELDEIYAKRNWEVISSKLRLGSYVSFTDKSFQEEPLLIRITGIKEYVNKPYSPILEISNAALAGTLIGELNRIENQEAETDDKFNKSRQFTKRRFNSVQESVSMLQAAFDGFSPGIDPVTVQTMTLVSGDPRSQFAFTKSRESLESVQCPIYYDALAKKVVATSAALVHFTIDVDSVTAPNVREAKDYKSWNLVADESELLEDGSKSYYVCIRAPKNEVDAYLHVTDTPVAFDVDGDYYLYVGILNSEHGGTRDFATIYGFSEVAPGRIVTNVIRSADGSCYFDLENNEIGGKIKFLAGSEGIENLGSIGGQNMLRNSGFTGDYLSDELEDEDVLDAAKQLYNSPFAHWTDNDAEAVESNEAISGKEVRISGGGYIQQTLYHKAIANESYVVSFKAKGASLTVRLGEDSMRISLTDSWKRYVVKFIPVASTDVFGVVNADCSICDLQLERGTIATSWSNSFLDNSSDRAYYQSLKYLQDAIAGATEIGGGLILTEQIRVGDYDHENKALVRESAGVNGIYNNDNDISFWAGGSLADAITAMTKYADNPSYQPTDEELASMAKFVVSHGGKAILNDIILRGYIYAVGGKIGNLRIEKNGISVDVNNTSNNGGRISFSSQGLDAIQKDGSFVQLGTCGSQAISISGKDAEAGVCYGDEDKYKIAAQINAADKGHAIHCLSGLFAGLRPMIREIYESDSLGDLDHTIIVNNDAEITLYLQSYPRTGQTYKIIHRTDKKVNISAGRYVINTAKSWAVFSSFSNIGVVTLTYHDGLWYAEIS